QDNGSEDSYYQVTTIDMTTITDIIIADTITTITDTTNFVVTNQDQKEKDNIKNKTKDMGLFFNGKGKK
ncbi:2924_t:CDS:1, partial [Ambispora leptoticha]